MEKTNRISPSEHEEAESATNTPRSPRKDNWQDQPKKSESRESLEEYGEALKFDPDFSGPVKRRKCTDVICLGGFVAFLCVWIFVAIIGLHNGNIDRIIYPTNSFGQICGSGDLKDRPVLLFFDIIQCLNVATLATGCPTPQACVKECPKEAFSGLALAHGGKETEAKEGMRDYCFKMSDELWEEKSVEDLITDGHCPSWVLPSRSYLGRCLPLGLAANDTEAETEVISPDATMDNKSITSQTLVMALNALGAFMSVRNFAERVLTDLAHTWWMVGVAYIGATFISFIWVLLMRFIAGIMVWTGIFMVFFMAGGLFGYSLFRYHTAKSVAELQKNIFQVNITPSYFNDVLALADTWLAFSVILGIIFFIVLLILVVLRQRIEIAIKLIKQGSKAIAQVFSTIFWPVFPFLLHIVVLLWFGGVACYLQSAGNSEHKIYYNSSVLNSDVSSDPSLLNRGSSDEALTNFPKNSYSIERELDALISVEKPTCPQGYCINSEKNEVYMFNDVCHPEQFSKAGCEKCEEKIECQFTKYETGGIYTWMNWFNLFGFYWAMCFVSAYSEMVLAGVFAKWYWTWDKNDVPFGMLFISMKNTTVFHLGTIAFGSLIIAIIKFIRTVVSYVENKLKMYNNDLVRAALCLCKCCLWCLEKFMKFINRNAYIMCAIKGTNFCLSAKDAFCLLMRNIVRVVVLNNVVNFLLFLSQLVIVVGIGVTSYFVFSPDDIWQIRDTIPTLNYNATPTVFIVIGTYFITKSFFGVYSMAVDTLFLCFLEDMERNDGTPEKPYFMSRGLQKIVGKMQKFNVQKEEHRLEQVRRREHQKKYGT